MIETHRLKNVVNFKFCDVKKDYIRMIVKINDLLGSGPNRMDW